MGGVLLLRRLRRRVTAVVRHYRGGGPGKQAGKTDDAMRRAQAKAVRLEHKRRPGPPGGGG